MSVSESFPNASAVAETTLGTPRRPLGPAVLWQHRGLAGKIRWHLNALLTRRPWILNAFGATLTIVDIYGYPGDTLLTAIVCRHLRQRYPRLRLNCLTGNTELLRYDPNLNTLGQPETFFSVWSWYPDTARRRDPAANVLEETFARLGMGREKYEYRAKVYLSDEERRWGLARLAGASKPVLTFHIRTREPTKDWPVDRWRSALGELRERWHVVHLGDGREPVIDGVTRLAGQLTLRESLSVLAHARVHVGADSFLMHAANGLDVPSVIIGGGSRTAANVGYSSNANLYVDMACGPCWILAADGGACAHDLACMNEIRAVDVVSAVEQLGGRSTG